MRSGGTRRGRGRAHHAASSAVDDSQQGVMVGGMSDFIDRFDSSIDYPDLTEHVDLLPVGVLHCYVPSTFLNGWINHVKPVRAYLRTRYQTREVNERAVAAFCKMEHAHADLGRMFEDDIDILARDAAGCWWYLGFDRDVSDCAIGRFRTDERDDAVVPDFDAEYSNNAIELPIEGLRGWITF